MIARSRGRFYWQGNVGIWRCSPFPGVECPVLFAGVLASSNSAAGGAHVMSGTATKKEKGLAAVLVT
jgi:hypothetical protein